MSEARPPSILDRSVAWLTRYRIVVLLVVACGAGAVDGSEPLSPTDFKAIKDAGMALLRSDLAAPYADPTLQVGPLQLVVAGAIAHLAGIMGASARLVYSMVVQVVVTMGTVAVLRSFLAARAYRSPSLELAVGVTVIAAGLGWVAYISGHPEEAFIGLLWVAAAVQARRGNGALAGALLAASAGFKLWGLLGVPLLLLVPGRRAGLRGLGLLCGITVAFYVPFLVSGGFNTFDYRWPVTSPFVRSIVGEGGFDWGLRVAQGTIVVVIAVGLVLWRRFSWGAEWALPAAIVTIRVLIDPLPHYYLWLPFEVIALVATATLMAKAPVWMRVAFGVGFYAAVLSYYLPPVVGTLLRTLFAVFLLAAADRVGIGGESVRSSTTPEPASA